MCPKKSNINLSVKAGLQLTPVDKSRDFCYILYNDRTESADKDSYAIADVIFCF